MPRPCPQPPPRKTTSPGAVAGGMATPPEGGQAAARAVATGSAPTPAAASAAASSSRPGARSSPATRDGWGWWDLGTRPTIGAPGPEHLATRVAGDGLLFFGTYDAAAHPRVSVLRDGLREHGATVQECNAPFGLSTAARVSMLRRPWTLPLLGWRLLRCWSTLAVRSRF